LRSQPFVSKTPPMSRNRVVIWGCGFIVSAPQNDSYSFHRSFQPIAVTLFNQVIP
jgi:hypothetical protein